MIDSKSLEQDFSGKPVPIFSHPALRQGRLQEGVASSARLAYQSGPMSNASSANFLL
ncbi:hypothetical protein BOSE62_71231 [Bosea sp. 62]|nr:hypothetical protein BOSE46_80493 [Bosea sp. 46]CAD5297871.1 hypothetical protein BOSE7B_60264 [Bosea sp. 7B]VVT61050.1 hypothetical protein BOS5A_230327 [Bosea sp. EC-HK365B]VXB12523.1 hypothetical protein BOSE125_130018 [Bosea sp. 125]VXB30959.1 hypothetical protein BOSE127_110261 [Bosea sp. 127]VXC78246.1 hypothetical protein BOSE29B_80382 [Bosea sp. 29B]VXC88552.1 hypothetical protein BOSE62_71231 [Bosea sp. 62]